MIVILRGTDAALPTNSALKFGRTLNFSDCPPFKLLGVIPVWRQFASELNIGVVFVAAAVGLVVAPRYRGIDFFSPSAWEIDLGNLDQNQTAVAEFQLRNHSSVTVTIADVSHSCGCSEAQLSQKIFRPGEVGTLKAVWKTEQRRGSTRITVCLSLCSDDGDENRLLPLRVVGNVVPHVQIRPSEISFTKEGGIQERTINLSAERDHAFRLLDAKCSHSAFSCEMNAEKSAVVIRFDPSQWNPSQDFIPHIVLRSTSKHEPRIMLDLTVN